MQRILVADDEQSLRELFKDILENEGYQVETAADGKSALKKILNGGFDLILMDIIMPNMDGITLLRKLQKLTPQKKNGPIVIISVLEEQDFVRTSLKLGALDYIRKSEGTPADIINKVKNIIKLHPKAPRNPLL
jgi:CheY-like chemotaxis protein